MGEFLAEQRPTVRTWRRRCGRIGQGGLRWATDRATATGPGTALARGTARVPATGTVGASPAATARSHGAPRPHSSRSISRTCATRSGPSRPISPRWRAANHRRARTLTC